MVDDLEPGKPYVFRVRCRNQNGWSKWSDKSTGIFTAA